MRFESEALPLANMEWSQDWAGQSGRSMPISQSLRAVDDDRWLGSVVVQQIPDDTIALSNLCTELQLPDDEQHRIRVALLQQSVIISEKASPRYVRYLVSAKETQVLQALSAATFRSAGAVEEWTWSGESTTPDRLPPVGCVFYGIDAASIAEQSSSHFTSISTPTTMESSAHQLAVPRSVLCNLLDECLQHSNELPDLPLPSAHQLLRLWRLSRSPIQIVLAVQDNDPAGIMATNLIDEGSSGFAPELIIEYIGVRFNSRRNGIAAALLSLLSCGICGSLPPRQLTAFAGTDNQAAAILYRQLGFSSTASLAVWVAADR
ncbi:MAG: GNAT family N-acetyltransferase [Fuerstiella sp.]|nr:GNAT family N-acetyltransferase [Fuerstiella sp.]MCP4858074.1 GNAT family N-acetyltransferase [Fuerstiella sp.]